MSYQKELLANYMHLSNSIVDIDGLIRLSKIRQIVKLNRYISRSRGLHVPSAPYLIRMIKGRPNRTPWKCKGLPYVSKAERHKNVMSKLHLLSNWKSDKLCKH